MNNKGNSFVREEYKYFVSPINYPYLLNDLKNFTVLDSSAKDINDFYNVVSIYFENYTLSSYFDKLNGIAKRVKLRLRYYPLSSEKKFKIELKYKFFDKILKKRTDIKENQISALFSKNSIIGKLYPKDEILLKFFSLKKINNFYPFIRIDYDRIALVARIDKKIRVTVDKNIRCCRFSEDLSRKANISVFPHGTSILEIKTAGYFPFWLTYLIKKYFLKKSAVSKYTYSVQKLAVNSSLNIV